MKDSLNNIRETTLKQIEKNERNYKLTFLAAAVVEVIFIIAFLLLADLSNRTHILLLLITIVVYTMIGFGLIALGLHVNRNTLRVLRAVGLIKGDES
jgi:hypothetical protein